MTALIAGAEDFPLVVRVPLEVSDDQFFDFCRMNEDLRIERTAQNEIVIMPGTGGRTGNRNMRLGARLFNWALDDGSGEVFDSSTGFILPNSAIRSPDASWVSKPRLALLTEAQKVKFLPLCPEFVIELRSPSDRLPELRAKMQEYIDNGAQLGWLIDPDARRADVYRPGSPLETLESPETLSAHPVLPGFVLNLREIWESGW